MSHALFAPRFVLALSCVVCAVPMPTMGSVGFNASTMTSVPPAAYIAPASVKSKSDAIEEQRPFLAFASKTIALAPPSDKEIAALKSANASTKLVGAKTRPLTVGMGREVPFQDGSVEGNGLGWVVLPDGGRVARIDVRSPGAAAVRLGLVMTPADPAITLRFMGATPGGLVFGPTPANQVAETSTREGAFWTPVLEGDTGSIEVYAPPGAEVKDFKLTVIRISHLAVAGEGLRRIDPKNAADIGLAQSCEIDVACVANPLPALFNTAKSVAKMLLTRPDGVTLECTGTLINDSIVSFTPYFYSANHCVETQAAASTLNTYWFFDAIACNSKAVPPFVLLTHGATLLGRSVDFDWALLRLRDAPPSGAQFSAWRADPLNSGDAANTMHHPQGDLKKWSQGVAQGFRTFADGSTFTQMRWVQGSTEEGSSGAGLFTYAPAAGYYELRGGLFGGDASCFNPAAFDNFSRLDKALPVLRQYLTPSTVNPNGEVAVVEFYNQQLDHYFISSNPMEINDLDTGVHAGWVRTGLRFLAYGDPAQAPPGASPVCRFYLAPAVGDSHFYSGDPAECAATAQRFGDVWTLESSSVFWIVLPNRTTGACVAGTRPIYRFFHSQRTNHRYTAEVDIRDELKTTPGWIAEGYGPQAVIMCSPTD